MLTSRQLRDANRFVAAAIANLKLAEHYIQESPEVFDAVNEVTMATEQLKHYIEREESEVRGEEDA